MEKQGSDSTPSRGTYDGMLALIDAYFQSIYVGDPTALRSTFHPKCRLFAEVNGNPYEKSVDEYVDGVANRKSPRELGEPYLMEVIGIETLGSVALVRTHQQMLGFNYFDYLTLLRRDGQWLIVSKVFTNVNAAQAGR